MWILSRLSADGAALGLVMAIRLHGRLNPPALRQAALDIFGRHHVLGSVLTSRDGVPLQQPAARPVPPPSMIDLAGLRDAGDDGTLEGLLARIGRRRFDLEAGPLARTYILRIAPADHVVAVAMHHSVTDGWSVSLLADEFSTVYKAFGRGRPGPLAGSPSLQYAEFARQQRSQIDQPALERTVARLTGLPRTRVPVDRQKPADVVGPAALWVSALPPSLTASMTNLRRREGGSMFMLVLAALMTVLHRLDGYSEVSVGTLAAGRTRPELERMLGYFGNPLVIRAGFEDDLTFRELWRKVREDSVAAYADQDVPFELALSRMKVRRDGLVSPVGVLCVMQQEDPVVRLQGLRAEPVDVPRQSALFDLTVEVRPRAGALQLALQYDSDLYDRDTIAAVGGYLRSVLAAACADPDIRCDDIELRPPPVLPRPSPPVDDKETVHGLFEAQVLRTPDAVALQHRHEVVSFRALDQKANRLARQLRAGGAGPETIVAVHLPRSVDAIVALLAVLKAGSGYLALEPSLPTTRVEWTLIDSAAHCVITSSDLAGRLPPTSRVVLLEDAAPGGMEEHGDPAMVVSPDNLACLVYTSGTTGRPLGVMTTHRSLVNRFRWMWATYPFTADERAVHKTALGFVDSIWEIFGPLLQGVPAEIIDPGEAADPRHLARALLRGEVTRVVAVPSLLQVLLTAEADLGRLPALRVWVSSGEPLPPALAQRFHDVLPGRTLLNLYGSSEVAADVTAAEIAPGPGPVLIGAAIDGAQVQVVTADGTPAAPLVTGELQVSGVAVARGYHRAAGVTAARFRPDPRSPRPGERCFRTGDLARARIGGGLEFAGRADGQLQVRGHRVEPAEVEEALARDPRVREVAVAGRPDAVGGTALAAYVVMAEPCTSEELRTSLARVLPAYLVPTLVTFVDSLPRTASGKIARARLAEILGPEAAAAGQLRSPALLVGREEQAVAQAFADLLPVPFTDPQDDFFMLGGHSLLAVTLLERLRGRHGIDLGLRDLVAAPTIAGLAALARASGPAAPRRQAEVRAAPEDWFRPFPLTDVQTAYWVGRDSSLVLGNVATHSYFEIDVPELDHQRLTTAIRRLVDRHHALRTVLLTDGTQQVLRTVPDYEIPVDDLRNLPLEERERALLERRETMSHQVHPAGQWPLFDLRTCLLPDCLTRVCVSLDALVADAYSVQILLRELGRLYTDPSTELTPLRISFRDHVLAREAERRSAEYEVSLAYWRDRLATLPTGPDLPLALDPARITAPRFRRRSRMLSGARWKEIQERAGRAGLTATAAILAAYAEVLSVWSAHPHYTLALTLFDRDAGHADLAQVVGDFTSITLLEVDHRRPGTFLDRARALQERMWADLDHRAVSAVTVLREWARARGRPPGIVTPVVFTSNLGLPEGDVTAGADLGPTGFSVSQTPQLYLDHQVAATPDGLRLNWDAVDDLFPPGLVDQMFGAYVGLLEHLADDAGSWQEPVGNLLPAAQRHRRTAANATARALPDRLLHELVAAAADRHPDAPAVITTATTLSYADVRRRSAQVAHGLRDLGLRSGELVGVAVEKGWEQVVAAIAILAAGGAYVPLDPDLPADRMHRMASDTGLRLVLTRAGLAGRLAGLERTEQVPVDDEERWQRYPSGFPPPGNPHDLAYIIFTSGSSGVPKGVMIDHRGAVNTVLDINERFAVGPGDSVLGVSALSFDLSVYDIFGVLAAGATLVLPDEGRRRDPGHWLELAGRHGVTIWNSVPALLGLLAESAEIRGATGLEALRLALLSGDWIPLELPDRIHRLVPKMSVVSLGGATEASIWSVCFPIDAVHPDWTSIPYGRPLANQQLHVLDDGLRPRPDWVPGDLYIGGTALALGYWRDPERTAAAFVVDPVSGRRLYRTGDRARYRDDGVLEFLGREDLQIKVSGFRVELGDVEAALARLPGITACAVTATGPRGERRLHAFYVAEDADLDPGDVRSRLADLLPGYMIPSTFTRLLALPLSANGKVDRGALDMPTGPAGTGDSAPAEPGEANGPQELVGELTAIWAHILGVEDVTPDDNFFELGGTSLVAIRLLARLEAGYGVKIPLVRLYEAPTVTELARAIGSAPVPEATGDTTTDDVRSDPAHAHEPFPLTDVQEAYWLGRRTALRLGGVATHSYVELDIHGLDLDQLDVALTLLVERHPALRTVFLPDGRQQVLPGPLAYAAARSDLSGLSAPARQAELDRLRTEMSHQVRATDQWPLFEIRVTRLDDDLVRLHVSIDLLIADALSFRLLQRDLLLCYRGRAGELPPLRVTFRDHVLARQRQKDSDGYRAAREYWRERLATLPPPPALPMLGEVGEIERPRFSRLTGRLDGAGWATLRQAAATRNLTPSGLLCAVFAEVLATWSQRARFSLNLTTFTRDDLHPDIGLVVGDFTSTTVLAVDASDTTFTDRARRLQQQIFEDLEHRAFNGVEVLRLLRTDPRRRDDVLAPVVFTSTLQPGPADEPGAVGGWDAEAVFAVSQTPQILLDHQVHEHDGALIYSWDHVAGIFPPGLIEAMFTAYERLLQSLIRDDSYWKAAPAWTS